MTTSAPDSDSASVETYKLDTVVVVEDEIEGTEKALKTDESFAPTTNQQLPSLPPDGGVTAWLAVVASWFCHLILMGSGYTYGLFQRYYVANDTFPGTTTTQYALVGGLATFCGFFSGPLVGIWVTKVGNRTSAFIGSILFGANLVGASFAQAYWTAALCQGVFFGITSMLVWIPALQVAPQWFLKKRGLAMGICVSGAGIGGLALGPLTQYLLEHLGFRWTLRIWGLGGGFTCLCASFFLKMRVIPPGQWDLWAWLPGRKKTVATTAVQQQPQKKPPFIDFSLFKSFRFSLLFLACFFIFWGQNIPLYFVAQYTTMQIGASAATASIVLGVMNGCGTAGRIGMGFLSDRLGALNVLLVMMTIIIISIFALWLPGSYGTIGLLWAFAIFYGTFAGATMSMIPTVLTAICGPENFASKMGLLYISYSPGGLASPPLAGLSLDKTGSFAPMQIMTGVAFACALVSLVSLRVANGREADKARERQGKDAKERWLGKVRVM